MSKKRTKNVTATDDTTKQQATSASDAVNANVSQPDQESTQDIQLRFESELKWCLQSLESCLIEASTNAKTSNSAATERKLQESTRVYNTLRNPKTSVIRKRQLMNQYFGDYRTAMAKEKEKYSGMQTRSRIRNCLAASRAIKSSHLPSGKFLRKKANKSDLASSTSESTSFTFNFDANDNNQSA